jgi:hypothetical protein
MLAIFRVTVLIGLSLSAFVPAFAAPVRLSSPAEVYSDVIQTGALRARINPRSLMDGASRRLGFERAPQPTPHVMRDLLSKYEEHHGTYSDKPRALWKPEAAPPLAVEQHRTVDDRVRMNCNQHQRLGLPLPTECLCRAGLMTGAACAH